MTLRFHAQTAGSTLTAQQVDNNVVRVSLQALAAVLGGGLPEPAHELARRGACPAHRGVRPGSRCAPAGPRVRGRRDGESDPLAGSYCGGAA